MRSDFPAVLVVSFMLAACGGGAGESNDSPDNGTNVADAEAARAAAIYRYMQGLGSLMLANLSEVDVGGKRAGAVPCTGGGTAAYSDTTTAPGADPRAAIEFDACMESIGRIDGAMNVRNFLIRLNADGSGTFNVEWTADVAIDGYGMTFASSSGLVTRSSNGAIGIETFGGDDLALSLTATTGGGVLFSDARIKIAFDPGTGQADFGGSNLRMRDLSNADLGAKLLPTGLRAPVGIAVAVHSIGVPIVGSIAYQRSFDATATDIMASGTTNSSVLDLAVDALPASYNFPGSAGQYAWSTLIEAPDLSLPAGAP